jgi:hypothetical protein
MITFNMSKLAVALVVTLFMFSRTGSAYDKVVHTFLEQRHGNYRVIRADGKTRGPRKPTDLKVLDSAGNELFLLEGASYRHILIQFCSDHLLYWIKYRDGTIDPSLFGIIETNLKTGVSRSVAERGGREIMVSPDCRKMAVTGGGLDIIDIATGETRHIVEQSKHRPYHAVGWPARVPFTGIVRLLGWSRDSRDLWSYFDDIGTVAFFRLRGEAFMYYDYLDRFSIPGRSPPTVEERHRQAFNPDRGWVLHYVPRDRRDKKRLGYGEDELLLTDLVNRKTVSLGIVTLKDSAAPPPHWTGETTASYSVNRHSYVNQDVSALLVADSAPPLLGRRGLWVVTVAVLSLFGLAATCFLFWRRTRRRRGSFSGETP